MSMESVLKDWYLLDAVNAIPSPAEFAVVLNTNAYTLIVPETLACKLARYDVLSCTKHEESLEYYKRVIEPILAERPGGIMQMMPGCELDKLRSISLAVNEVWRTHMAREMSRGENANMFAAVNAAIIVEGLLVELKHLVAPSVMTLAKAHVSAEEWGVLPLLIGDLIVEIGNENTEENHQLAVKAITHMLHVSTFETQQAIDKVIHDKTKHDRSYGLFAQNPARLIKPVYWHIWGMLPLQVDIAESFWFSRPIARLNKIGILP